MHYLIAFGLIVLLLFGGCIQQAAPSSGENSAIAAQSEQEALKEDQKFIAARQQMVETQLKPRDISSEKVLNAMAKVQRQLFVPENLQEQAYADNPLPIGFGQTISQPYVVAFMTQALDIKEGEKVLEIGSGSGYQAAILAELTDNVYTIEIIPKLAENAKRNLKAAGYSNVQVLNADGYFGWQQHAPFDAIIITAATTHVSTPLIEQLKGNGRMILPLGSTLYYQTLTLITKKDSELETSYLIGVRFVPMTGEMQKKGS